LDESALREFDQQLLVYTQKLNDVELEDLKRQARRGCLNPFQSTMNNPKKQEDTLCGWNTTLLKLKPFGVMFTMQEIYWAVKRAAEEDKEALENFENKEREAENDGSAMSIATRSRETSASGANPPEGTPSNSEMSSAGSPSSKEESPEAEHPKI
jgi:hypothetical protein